MTARAPRFHRGDQVRLLDWQSRATVTEDGQVDGRVTVALHNGQGTTLIEEQHVAGPDIAPDWREEAARCFDREIEGQARNRGVEGGHGIRSVGPLRKAMNSFKDEARTIEMIDGWMGFSASRERQCIGAALARAAIAMHNMARVYGLDLDAEVRVAMAQGYSENPNLVPPAETVRRPDSAICRPGQRVKEDVAEEPQGLSPA